MEVLGREAELAESLARLVRVEEASVQPYANILSYPRLDEAVVASRIRQLKRLGVIELEFTGQMKLGRLSLLGKGVAGMVVAGLTSKERIALKIRRVDSRRDRMQHEALMMRAANALNVGPRYVGSTADVLAMELVEGLNLPSWLGTLKGRGRRARLRRAIGDLLEQCFRLDEAGLDHGELSRAHKNIIVRRNGQPCIVDFESASKDRRTNNLTALSQYFFLGGGFSRKVSRILGPTDPEKVKSVLRSYKSERSPGAFRSALEMLKLRA